MVCEHVDYGGSEGQNRTFHETPHLKLPQPWLINFTDLPWPSGNQIFPNNDDYRSCPYLFIPSSMAMNITIRSKQGLQEQNGVICCLYVRMISILWESNLRLPYRRAFKLYFITSFLSISSLFLASRWFKKSEGHSSHSQGKLQVHPNQI